MLMGKGIFSQKLEPIGIHGFKFGNLLGKLRIREFSVVQVIQKSLVTYRVYTPVVHVVAGQIIHGKVGFFLLNSSR